MLDINRTDGTDDKQGFNSDERDISKSEKRLRTLGTDTNELPEEVCNPYSPEEVKSWHKERVAEIHSSEI